MEGGYNFRICKQKYRFKLSTVDECEQNENEGENRCNSYQEVLNLLTKIENFAKIADQDLMNPVIEMKALTEAKINKKQANIFPNKYFRLF